MKTVTTKQLEEMYEKYQKKLWREHEDVRGDDMIEVGYAPTTKNDSPKYCDRSICLKNEYNNVGCEDCEVTKSQEPTTKNDIEVEEMIKLVRESDVIDRTDGSVLAKAFNYLFDRYIEKPTAKNDLGVDAISRAEAQTEIEMIASRYTISKERGGMGQVEWSDQLIKVSDAVDIIRHLPPVTPQEPFINKSCVSSGVCEHDKQNVLDKIRTEIIERDKNIKSVRSDSCCFFTAEEVLEIIDKYKADIKPQESEG